MTDVPSKHVWKIEKSRIVYKDFNIIAGCLALLDKLVNILN